MLNTSFVIASLTTNEAVQNGCKKNQQTQFCHAGPRSGIPELDLKEEIQNQSLSRNIGVQNDIHFGQPQKTDGSKQSPNLSNGVKITSQACLPKPQHSQATDDSSAPGRFAPTPSPSLSPTEKRRRRQVERFSKSRSFGRGEFCHLSNGVALLWAKLVARNDCFLSNSFSHRVSFLGIFLMLLFMVSCSSSTELMENEEDWAEASISVNQLLESVPNYRESLQTISGSGRAIVSEPGNSERVTLRFLSNRTESLITVRTSLGIEGGQIFVDSDSLLVYNRVDKFAEKVPLNQGKLTSVGSIASVNMLDLFNYTFIESDVDELFETVDFYVAILVNGVRVQISKKAGRVLEVNVPEGNRSVPYSRIIYEGYGEIESFQLPRKITIFSQDGESRATLLVQNLEINDELPELGIELPDDIPIYR